MLRYLLPFLLASSAVAADWPQASGPEFTFQADTPAPTEWSVVHDTNIAWKITLNETGQSTPVVCRNRVFVATMKPVHGDAKVGKDIVASCYHSETGNLMWQRNIVGRHPLRLSGCFSDSSAPGAVCDGERVVFINASGMIACFDMQGTPIWSKEILSVGRTLPFLHNGSMVFIRQIYPPEPDGRFPHTYKDAPRDMWTQLQAIDMQTGEVTWTTTCGCNMGCAPLKQSLTDGRSVAVVGRGGGHGPPEKPDGISLVDLADGSTLWSLPLSGFMSTQTYSIRNNQVHLFHKDEHLSVDATSGNIVERTSILENVPVCRYSDGRRLLTSESITSRGKGRMITQGSNLLVDRWHYFRSYTRPYVGRVNVDTGSVEYLELPLQLRRGTDKADEFVWFQEPPPTKKKSKDKSHQIQNQGTANEVRNARGFVVMGDSRSIGNGWGHIAAPTMTVANSHLYIPIMSGTVYVLKWDAATFDENAIVAINDLGPLGESWTRASISFAGKCAYAHTISSLICIGQ